MAAKNAIKVSVAIMVSTQRRFGRDVYRTREPPSSTNGGDPPQEDKGGGNHASKEEGTGGAAVQNVGDREKREG